MLHCSPRRLALFAAAALTLLAAAPAQARVLDVTKRHVGFAHFTTIQGAVNAARGGDWIVIDRGVYPEAVRIRKSNLHLRGIDRNRVIVDGRHRKGVNGIEIFKANNVWVENLTVRNFDRDKRDGENGNQVWWNGGDGSGRIGARGWYGQYLTTYDTGLIGGYGLFASNAVNGFLKHVYASGFNDSGLYIGACRDCNALVDDALIERNGLGYSGTNSGGRITVRNSTFRNNSNGVGPNSLNNDDKPPPQDGACNSGSNRSLTPTFTSTNISRCTVFRNNRIENNGNLSAPANASILSVPWGNGVILIGTYADVVQNNAIRGNPNFGLLGFENPDPFPPTPQTVYFQLAGNRVANNRFSNNGTRPNGADIGIADLGPLPGSPGSVNNCFTGNVFTTSNPANIEGTWGCQNTTTPAPGPAMLGSVITLSNESQARHSVPQPAPPRQKTMPRPCAGPPRAGSLC
jgi:hypothetical protein